MKKWAWAIAPFVASVSVAASRPNIVLILADDLGPGEVGCYGQKMIRTPNIDKLAAEGMRFTQAYSGSPVCAPSRCSLLTGLHTGHTYIRDNKETPPEGQLPIPADTVTIANVLKDGGYSTACIGKWGLGFIGTTGDPLTHGFDFFYGHNCQAVAHNQYADHLWRNDEKIVLEGNSARNANGAQYTPDLMRDEAIKWLREKKGGAFFLDFATPLPHLSLQAPADALKEYQGKLGPEKPFEPKSKDYGYFACAEPHATYAAMVTRIDDYVGQIMAELKADGLDDNTVVIFASDNGPTFHIGGADSDFFNSTMGLRGRKEEAYEGGIRVPMIIRWPGHVKPETASDFATVLYDLYPTFAELTGTAGAKNIDGVSLVPTMTGTGAQKEHDYLYWEFASHGGQQAIRKGNWKAVRTGIRKNKSAPVQLYDLASDPNETKDVAAEHPEMAKKLGEMMKKARTPSQVQAWEIY
jgi:arylsulfatase A